MAFLAAKSISKSMFGSKNSSFWVDSVEVLKSK